MPQIGMVLCPANGVVDHKTIALMLSRDALFMDPDGIPFPGIEFSPEQARRVAARLVTLADQAEGIQASDKAGPSW